jgi:hypothetical protein
VKSAKVGSNTYTTTTTGMTESALTGTICATDYRFSAQHHCEKQGITL